MSQSLAKFLDLIQFLTPKPLTEIKAGFREGHCKVMANALIMILPVLL